MVINLMKTAQQIFDGITKKGWLLYYSGPTNAKISISETYKRGPVTSLEQNILYIILPKTAEPKSKATVDRFIEKHQTQPKITVPHEGLSYFGMLVVEFSGTDELKCPLMPGDEISFIGIELTGRGVRLLAPSKTSMPYDVFLLALQSLQDINGLEQ